MPEKVIRDPVHDVIALRTDDPAEGLLFELLNAREFQRLRRVRQLGMASLAYPGADHSRYSHSLGVMQTARLMLDRLARQMPIDPGDRLLVLAAALLHDLGHGPFSHVFERVTGVHHEKLTGRVILDPESEVHQILIRRDVTLPERLVDSLGHPEPRDWRGDVLSSQLDADRLDYLLRDNLMTGSRYGHFDLGWLLQALIVEPAGDRLCVVPKGVSAVEAYLQARYHMYRNVYFHKVVRAAEAMVQLVLGRAKTLAAAGELDWPAGAAGVGRALVGERMTMAEFLDLDDAAVMQCLKVWADGPDAGLARLCDGLLFRRLFKTIDLAGHPDPPAAVAAAGRAIEMAGGDSAAALFYDELTDTPYKADADVGEEILVAAPGGGVAPLTAYSPLVGALGQPIMFRRLHVAPEYREAAAHAVQKTR